jgi:hypothetical protein
MLHEEFTACPALLRGSQTVSLMITMHTDMFDLEIRDILL